MRNAGVGQQLLMAIKDWAYADDLELLVVWPSERAYPFYERAGFQRYPDPLVLRLRTE
jgi:GNAT superfamily N-acetyltransferase